MKCPKCENDFRVVTGKTFQVFFCDTCKTGISVVDAEKNLMYLKNNPHDDFDDAIKVLQ